MTRGILDDLIPGLRRSEPAPAPGEAGALHPRVLVARPEGGEEWILIAWRDPGGAQALHRGVARLVEGAFLAELSRPPKDGVALARKIAALMLILFEEPEGAEEALAAFGFRREEETEHGVMVEAAREEAGRVGEQVAKPASIWRATIDPGPRAEELRALQRELGGRLGERCWGEEPGRPSRELMDLLGAGEGEVDLDRLERAVTHDTPGVLRYIPPLLFQALCDHVGVVVGQEHGIALQWSVCTPGPDGFCDPPLFRAEAGEGYVHIPIGLHVLRWSIMPRLPDEEIPPLFAWVSEQFG